MTPCESTCLNSGTLQAIDERLHQLSLFSEATSYSKQKDSLQKELERFLGSLPGCPTLMSVIPRDICRFLVFKDQNGRTQVHKNGCSFLGQRGLHQCDCPVRLSYKTVDSYIGKLRAIFHALGRTGEWDQRLDMGNPATDKALKDYLRVVTMEQLQARVQPKQATPFFIDKLDQLVTHIEQSMKSPSISPTRRFILARDQAYFKAVFLAEIDQVTWGKLRSLGFFVFPITMDCYLIMYGGRRCETETPIYSEFNEIPNPTSALFVASSSIWPFLTNSELI